MGVAWTLPGAGAGADTAPPALVGECLAVAAAGAFAAFTADAAAAVAGALTLVAAAAEDGALEVDLLAEGADATLAALGVPAAGAAASPLVLGDLLADGDLATGCVVPEPTVEGALDRGVAAAGAVAAVRAACGIERRLG